MEEREGAIPNAATIRTWIDHERAQLEVVRAQMEPLVQEEKRRSDRLARLQELLATYNGQAPEPPGHAGPSERRESTRDRVRRQVATILRGSEEPVHILDVWTEFRERGWEIPGAGNAANITAHLTGAPEIVSPRRGYYRLRQEGERIDSSNTTNRQRKAGKRRSAVRGSK